MSGVRQTSIKCYQEIQEEGFKDSWKEIAYNAVKETPLMTAREYFEYIIPNGKREQIFPRLTELKEEGCIVEIGKRKCSVSKRTVYILATLEGVEQMTLKRLGFKMTQHNLYSYNEGDVILFQDFRNGKRRSYTIGNKNKNYKELDIYTKFKAELNNLLCEIKRK